LGAFVLQQPALANTLRAARHGALARLPRPARRGQPLLGAGRGGDHSGQPYPTHSFDTGAAWENLALQATLDGLVAHGMQGFDYERARAELNIPEGFRVEAMAVVGRPGDPSKLPEKMRARETPSDRKPLSEIIREGPFNF
jgi:nitroreductase